MIGRVYHLRNDILVIYDKDGALRTDLGGKFDVILPRILPRCTPSTRFFIQGMTFPVSRELFETKEYWNQIWGRKPEVKNDT